MASIPNIFEDPRSAEHETTASEARADAPDAQVARQVEAAANLEHQAAEQAASVAKTLGSKYTGEEATSVDKLRNQPTEALDQAVEEGKRDVGDIQAAGAKRLGQVKETAAKATTTAQEYLSSAAGQRKETQGDKPSEASTYVPSVQGVTTTVVDTAMGTLASAKATAQNTMETITSTTQNLLGTAGLQGAQVKDMPASSTGIPATTAPLESGAKKVDAPYPKTGASHEAKDVAQNEPRKSTIN